MSWAQSGSGWEHTNCRPEEAQEDRPHQPRDARHARQERWGEQHVPPPMRHCHSEGKRVAAAPVLRPTEAQVPAQGGVGVVGHRRGLATPRGGRGAQ